jgi:hypothetical protein
VARASAAEVRDGALLLGTSPVPACAVEVDLARRKADVAYPWASASGSACHVGIVALHGGLEILVDFAVRDTNACALMCEKLGISCDPFRGLCCGGDALARE